MAIVNIHEAKSTLSKLIADIESGAQTEIVIARNGQPAARIVPMPARPAYRFGLAKGRYQAPRNLDALNDEIEQLFYGSSD